MLEDAAREQRAALVNPGKRPPNKGLVILLDDEESGYEIDFYMSNMCSSEVLALLEAFKAQTLRRMELI